MFDQKTPLMIRTKKSPTPLLHSPKAMELILSKERMRCDRHDHYFSLVVIQLGVGTTRNQLRLLAKILHKRLRFTDEKGMLRKGGVGVLLPMTGSQGARTVLNSIVETASENGIEFESEVFTYSGGDGPCEGDSDCGDFSISPVNDAFVIRTSSNGTIVEASMHALPGSGSTATISQAVRADNESQSRRVGAGELSATSTLSTTLICPRYPIWKRAMDILCAAIGLFLTLPLILIAAIAIKLTSKGPVFFRQLRSGQYGNAFPVYKLRTMVVDAEELKEKLQVLNERDGPAFKIKNDPRVTRVGSILRKTGLDELPQLWNVMMGDMAIVGPRPLPCNEDAKCKTWQRRRLDTKPGLTCVWQISKSRKISFSDWMRMDLRYTDQRTITGDIGLMIKTIKAVLLGRVGH